MGHLGHLREEHEALARRLDAGTVGMPKPNDEQARIGWQEILEILYTPQEAALAARLPVLPSSLEKISKRVGIPAEDLEIQLGKMADKGLVMDLVDPKSGRARYLLSPPVVGFFEYSMMRAHDSIPKRRMAEALDAYTHGDDTFAREVFGGDTVVGRTMVHETALSDEQLPEVLDWERATAVISEARKLSVSYCYCRHKAEHLGTRCEAPMENCVSLNVGADFVIRRGFGRETDSVEALEILAASREAGLVQIADNVQKRPAYVCNCCGCCCGQLRAINDFDLPAVNPSHYVAEYDEHQCVGCSRCARACPIGAIQMKPVRVTARKKNDMVPEIDTDRCIGCGVCVGACRKDSMFMRARAKKPQVPKNAIERSVRMAIERGRLPHLLADQGASRGSAFLNRALQALCSLPPAKKALASEQVRSRFIGYLLGR